MSNKNCQLKFEEHLHVYQEELIEFRVITRSSEWCWQTFLIDAITPHPIICFISIIKKISGNEPVVRIFSPQKIKN
jgi:hypothetical protein